MLKRNRFEKRKEGMEEVRQRQKEEKMEERKRGKRHKMHRKIIIAVIHNNIAGEYLIKISKIIIIVIDNCNGK